MGVSERPLREAGVRGKEPAKGVRVQCLTCDDWSRDL